MWLNEGFTTFCERKITGMPKSTVTEGPDFAKVEAILGNAAMVSDMLGYGLTNSYSSLYPIING